MALPTISGEFRIVDDPELRFTPSGKAVANARIVADKQKKNEQTGEWEDDKICWLNLTVWDKAAENFVESCPKGTLVMIEGTLETRAYETREGEKRQSYDVTGYKVGVSTRFRAVRVLESTRAATTTGPAGGAPQGDSWATQAQGDEPPF